MKYSQPKVSMRRMGTPKRASPLRRYFCLNRVQSGENPVTAELNETILSCQLDDLAPTLARYGYRLKDTTE